jgi:hypothetical protein
VTSSAAPPAPGGRPSSSAPLPQAAASGTFAGPAAQSSSAGGWQQFKQQQKQKQNQQQQQSATAQGGPAAAPAGASRVWAVGAAAPTSTSQKMRPAAAWQLAKMASGKQQLGADLEGHQVTGVQQQQVQLQRARTCTSISCWVTLVVTAAVVGVILWQSVFKKM